MNREILFYIGIIVMSMMLMMSIFKYAPYDTTDDELNGKISGMSLHTDNLTGCQYLSKLLGDLTPRIDGEGNHIGCR